MSEFGIPFVGFERGYFLDIQNFFPKKQLIGHKILSSACNLRCYYCHRRAFLDAKYPLISPKEILAKLHNLESFNTVVLTGGEITLYHQPAIEIMKVLKNAGITTLFSTNGCFPERVEKMLPFADVVKIDIKGHKSQYKSITGQEPYASVLKSIATASEKIKVEVKIILHRFTEPKHINDVLEDVYQYTGMPPNLAIEFQPIKDFMKLGIVEPDVEQMMKVCAVAKPLSATTLFKHYGEKERIYKLEGQTWKVFREKEIPLRFNWNDNATRAT